MEMSSGKVLDEACNHQNDAYSDEVLYAEWTAAPQVAARLAAVEPAPAVVRPARVDLEALMARLYAAQE